MFVIVRMADVLGPVVSMFVELGEIVFSAGTSGGSLLWSGITLFAVAVVAYWLPLKALEGNKYAKVAGFTSSVFVTIFFFSTEDLMGRINSVVKFVLMLALAGTMTSLAYKGYKKDKDDLWSKFFLSFSFLLLTTLFYLQFFDGGIFYSYMDSLETGNGYGGGFGLVLSVVSILMLGSWFAVMFNSFKLVGSFFYSGSSKTRNFWNKSTIGQKNESNLKLYKGMTKDLKESVVDLDNKFEQLKTLMVDEK